MRCIAAALLALAILVNTHVQQLQEDTVECRRDTQIPRNTESVPENGVLGKRGMSGRTKSPPETQRFAPRSIVECKDEVERREIEEHEETFAGIRIGGVVSIIESQRPWLPGQPAQGLPVCSGMFIERDKILTSAHCVYQQKRAADSVRQWLFGSSAQKRRYYYAIAGKVSASDASVFVHPIQMACVPTSYTRAKNESVTSGQRNDLAVLSTIRRFEGHASSIGLILHSLTMPGFDEARDYFLPQYPLDVANGTQLVVDATNSPIYATAFMGGTFHAIDLVSWIGSSGGPIIDTAYSLQMGRPVLAGVLMSGGWQKCDSGMLPIALTAGIIRNLANVHPRRTAQGGQNNRHDVQDGKAPSGRPPPPMGRPARSNGNGTPPTPRPLANSPIQRGDLTEDNSGIQDDDGDDNDASHDEDEHGDDD